MTTKVGIIGHKGYIGSALFLDLQNCEISFNLDDIDKFDIILYVAGKASRELKDTEINQNVGDIKSIVEKMKPNKLLIYASTSAIAEGFNNMEENMIPKLELLDSYSISMLAREKIIQNFNIRSVGLRLATVVGLSTKQRSDRVHIQMLKKAFFTGRIHVSNPNNKRPIISMKETVGVFQTLIDNSNKIKGHSIYNIASFNTNISSIASSVALLTNSKLIYSSNHNNLTGFTINNQKFQNDFDYKFTSTNESIIRELWEKKDQLINSWSNPRKNLNCLICDNDEMTELIDLGLQPLANQFTQKEITCPSYPLAMYRCLQCQHNQLGHIIPPEDLFKDYIYVSGTAQTNNDHFQWFSDQIFTKIGTILDIACNDGTQLDKFKEKGWKTYGVDPAENLSTISRSKGHEVIVGFWGDEKVSSQLPDYFDIITAQNVFAHVPNPTKFIIECKSKMIKSSFLYIQTSQAELFFHGEFDTLYHEHISFFTIKSMLYLSQKVGLYLLNVQKVPIHGVSYIFTFKLPEFNDIPISENVQQMIDLENDIYSPYNSILYRSNVNERREIINNMINIYSSNGFTVIGFGASAKGNTLLNSLKNPRLEYIIDENKYKQNLYTPGTKIPVVSYDKLINDNRNLAVVILAWNFLEEIKEKIAKVKSTAILIVPFPYSEILLLKDGVYTKMSSFPLKSSLKETKRPKKLLITHFYNEEFLLPYWIKHHSPMFDDVILINYKSTDKSCEIIKELAPHWKIVETKCPNFDAKMVDDEVREIEISYPDDTWKLALTITEFLIFPNIDQVLTNVTIPSSYKINSLNIVGDDDQKLESHLPLIQQRNKCTFHGFDYSRYIHTNTNHEKNLYHLGRHSLTLESQITAKSAPEAMIFKYLYSPWPHSIFRKLQIGNKLSTHAIEIGAGVQHLKNLEQLENERNSFLGSIIPDFYNIGLNAFNLDYLRSKILYEALELPWSAKI